jgi:glycosyltransferase involved in cell wall biosynthesis
VALRIGIDATCWANGRGYGRFTRELVRSLVSLAPQHEFICFLDARAAEQFDIVSGNVRAEVVRQTVSPTLAATTGGGRSPFDILRMTSAVTRQSLDTFLQPSVYGYFPLPPGLPAVVTVHDAIPERFPSMTLPSLKDRAFWWAKVRLALAQARLILTVSDYAAREIVKYLRVPASHIRVTLEGVAAEYRPSESTEEIRSAAARLGLPRDARWITYVGGFGAHKHVDLLVRATAAVAKRRPGCPLMLVLAGAVNDGFHSDVATVREAIRDTGADDLVRWGGYVPDSELRHLHSGAVALALVSASEGFGLPAVEAARCGTPVLATTESPLPQLLEGGGIFVNPGDASVIESALERLLSNEQERLAMGRRALERASALSWDRSAKVTLDALETVARPQ